MLKQYIKDNKLSVKDFAKMIGISRQGLYLILESRSPRILYSTAMKIKKATGLNPWDYCDGLEFLKSITPDGV